jgi:hypothetical protein
MRKGRKGAKRGDSLTPTKPVAKQQKAKRGRAQREQEKQIDEIH